jgi:hypothetical protein
MFPHRAPDCWPRSAVTHDARTRTLPRVMVKLKSTRMEAEDCATRRARMKCAACGESFLVILIERNASAKVSVR